MRIVISALLALSVFVGISSAVALSDRPTGFASIAIPTGPYAAPAGTTGGGDALPVVACDARTLALLLADDIPRTILITSDIDLSFPVETQDAPPNVDLMNQPDVDGLPNGTRPLSHPFFFENGRLARVPSSIRVGANKTIYSADGKSLLHGGLVIRSKGNVIVRNLRFADLWEWDELTYPLWDRNTWDFLRIEEGAHHVWVDHCTFQHAYDGYVDVVRRSDFVTVSWCKYDSSPMVDLLDRPAEFANAFDTSWIGQQYNTLVKTGAPKFLADPTVKGKDLAATATKMAFVEKWGRHWKNTLIGNSNVRTFDRTHLNVTMHHTWWHHAVSRAPRARFGNIHLFNNLIEGIDNGVMLGFEAHVLAEGLYFLNGKNHMYGNEGYGQSIDCVFQGAKKNTDADFARIDPETGAVIARAAPVAIGFPAGRESAEWHPVGNWWKKTSGGMEKSLPYEYAADSAAAVPAKVIKGAGAGTIALPAKSRSFAAAEHWSIHCASCHGVDGDAKTVVGLRWEMRDFSQPGHQSLFSDAQAQKIIADGVARDALYRMGAYKERLSSDEIGSLVAYVRTLVRERPQTPGGNGMMATATAE